MRQKRLASAAAAPSTPAFAPPSDELVVIGSCRRRVALRGAAKATVGAAAAVLALGGCGLIDDGSLGAGDADFGSRVYLGAGALVSQLEPDTDGDTGVELDEEQGAGGSFAIGYDIGNRFSIEGHVAALGAATLEPEGEIDYQVGGLSGIVYGLNEARDRALREGFSVFGRLGIGTMRNEASDVEFERVNDVHLLAGAGVEYGLGNGLALRGEVVAHESDARYAQLGLLYRFGEAGGLPASTPLPADADGADGADGATPDAVSAPASPARSALDGDGDGVADADDACDDTLPGRPIDASGCDALGGVIEGVAFEPGADRLAAESEAVLSGVAATLREYPAITVAIEAHTDNQGSAEGNLDLSRRRALAVARYLAAEGVAAQRLKPRAYGESQPRASNASPAGRAENRRIELSVVE